MASPSWVILGRQASASADLPEGAALSLALATPPRATLVALHPTVCPLQPDPTASARFPCIVAADPSGILLLLTPPPLSERDDVELRTWRGPDGVERSVRIGRVPSPRCVVCDVSSASAAASPVPDPDPNGLIFNNNLGVIAAPEGGRGFMVVEFQHIVGGREATLLCFSSETGGWVKKRVPNPQPGPGWLWTFSDVVSHGGKIWWVDKVSGLLGCDPFPDEPAMEYVHLPRGDAKRGPGCCGICSERDLGSRRLVQLSNGVFRCVEMSCACATQRDPKVSMLTLADPATGEWTLEYEASFAQIWAGVSYKAAGLPEKAPVLALVHPGNPDVVYFFLEERLFGVDMRAREVVGCEPYESDKPHKKGSFTSWLVFPFQLPSTFSIGSGDGGNTSGCTRAYRSPITAYPGGSRVDTASLSRPDMSHHSGDGLGHSRMPQSGDQKRLYSLFYDLDTPWWTRRSAEIFWGPDPTCGPNALRPVTPPRPVDTVLFLPSVCQGARGRRRHSRRSRSVPAPLAGQNPQEADPVLAVGTGPKPGQDVKDYIWSRYWDLWLEYESILIQYQACLLLEEIPFSSSLAKEAWNAFKDRIDVCVSVRREIRQLGGAPPAVPTEFVDAYFLH